MINIDRQKIEQVLSVYHIITGFRVAIFDVNYNELISCPEKICDFCYELRKNAEAEEICRACDVKACEKAKESKNLYIYVCDFGLNEAVTPIYDGEKLIGYMMIGQMLATKSGSKEIVYWKSKRLWKSLQNRQELLEKLPLVDYRNIKASAMLMNICASYITLTKQVTEKNTSKEKLLLDFIKENYKIGYSDKQLYEKFGLSRTAYYDAISKGLGVTKTEFVNAKRIEEAKRLLTTTDMTIAEISRNVGFKDQNYFSRIFSRLSGMSPLKYRSENRKSEV
jgi:AraC-like DNA-binding protein